MGLQRLREKLEKGFYLDNLYEMAHHCGSLVLGTTSPAPFFMREVFPIVSLPLPSPH